MNHVECDVPILYVLGSIYETNSKLRKNYEHIGNKLLNTCYQLYNSDHLIKSVFNPHNSQSASNLRYIQPEFAESLLVFWKIYQNKLYLRYFDKVLNKLNKYMCDKYMLTK